MKRLRAAGVASMVVFAACATTNFVGETYPPTESVDIFFSAADIPGEYRVMGRAETHGSEYLDFEAIEQQLVKDAMGRGANAILIEGMDEITTGSVTTTSSGGDATPRWVVRQDGTLVNVGHAGHYSSFSSTSEVHERVISAQLIRYTGDLRED